MRVCFQQFFFQNHSWSYVGQNIARGFIKKGHEVELFPTDAHLCPEGVTRFPADLKPYIKNTPRSDYGAQISYTAMRNFPNYLGHGNKNRFGIWCYEWKHLPPDFVKYYKFTNKILAPSQFAKDCFVHSKVPESHVEVVPHGIYLEDFENKNKFPLKTQKKIKILVDIGQNHIRKNIPGMFEAFGRAFDKKDDICLVAKIISKKELKASFEVNIWQIFDQFKKKYPNHAEIELITSYVPNMVELYNACDISYTLSYTEGFWLPGLLAQAVNHVIIAPKYGGQLDFLFDDNSILIDGKMTRADRKMQYWTPNIYNEVFNSDLNDAAEKLRYVVKNYENLKNKFMPKMQEIIKNYTWENVTDKIINMCER